MEARTGAAVEGITEEIATTIVTTPGIGTEAEVTAARTITVRRGMITIGTRGRTRAPAGEVEDTRGTTRTRTTEIVARRTESALGTTLRREVAAETIVATAEIITVVAATEIPPAGTTNPAARPPTINATAAERAAAVEVVAVTAAAAMTTIRRPAGEAEQVEAIASITAAAAAAEPLINPGNRWDRPARWDRRGFRAATPAR